MKFSAQIIYGADEQPLFAVLPYEAYVSLQRQVGSAVAFEEGAQRFVRLPHAGPKGRLDVLRLVEFLTRANILEIAVNKRAQIYEKFPQDQQMTLDPLIRREFLGLKSPYVNTMQAINEVIDSLVQTGLFERSKMKHPAFFRAVNSVKLNVEKVAEFLGRFPPLAQEEKIQLAQMACGGTAGGQMGGRDQSSHF
jgi:hypothetical protein